MGGAVEVVSNYENEFKLPEELMRNATAGMTRNGDY